MRLLLAILLAALAQEPSPARRVNELTLAGVRPGRDTLSVLERRFPAKSRVAHPESESLHEWADACTGLSLLAEVDAQGVIQSVTIAAGEPRPEQCASRTGAFHNRRYWSTGRGFALQQSCKRALAIYSTPASRGPSFKGGREFELLYYEFDWAGPDVPQVMEISCDRTSGRAVQITLAFPSL